MNIKPLIAAGTLMGVGLGGFVDGIVFHQILQVHNMLSAQYPPETIVNIKANMVWDGLFHTLTWIATVISVMMLWRAVKRQDVPLSGVAFLGANLMGWGLFNLVEGIINHHVLHLHHVVELRGESVYDYLFLGSGMMLTLTGYLLIKSAMGKISKMTQRQGDH